MKNVSRYAAIACALALFASFGSSSAAAITAEVAKKCNAMRAKAFPPRQPGNPAAGSAQGSGSDEQAYFKKCIANGGNPPSDDAPKK
jgi:hypothetical protein